jgi:hypothetical protein
MTRALVYVPDGGPDLGALSEIDLPVIAVGPTEVMLADVTAREEPGQRLIGTDRDLCFAPHDGGGPMATPVRDREARAFGLVNAAYHAQRAMLAAAQLLGHPLPHLVLRVGAHGSRRWGGGHYRLPSAETLAECGEVGVAGEVHLGGGARFVTRQARPYFQAPAHHASIIYHEVGHHICRHTADFRLNRLRDPHDQANRKVALDEGSADYLTAMLLGTPDIYGWHRGHLPAWDQRRRLLRPQWTMDHFVGGKGDPHADGTIWASALWSAREAVAGRGLDPGRFDAMVLRGLRQSADDEPPGLGGPEGHATPPLRRRRYFSRVLAAIVVQDPELAPTVIEAMAAHGIALGASNAVLRQRTRDRTAASVAPDGPGPSQVLVGPLPRGSA